MESEWREWLDKAYKELESLHFETATNYMALAVTMLGYEGMLEVRPEMAYELASAICRVTRGTKLDFGYSHQLFAMAKTYGFGKEDTFSQIVMDEIENRLDSVSPDDIPMVFLHYADVAFFGIISCTDPRVMIHLARRVLSFFNLDTVNGRFNAALNADLKDVMDSAFFYAESLLERLEPRMETVTDLDLSDMIAYRIKSMELDYIEHLQESLVLSFNMANKKPFAKSKLKEQAEKELDTAVEMLFTYDPYFENDDVVLNW